MGATTVVVLVAAVLTAALLLPDVSGDPYLAPASEEPPVDAFAAVDDVCRGHRPSPAPAGVQTSAPRSVVAPGPDVPLGVRDRFGSRVRSVAVDVISPAGATASTDTRVEGPAWTYVQYPSDFPRAARASWGTYRVAWRDDAGATLACDGFVIGGRP